VVEPPLSDSNLEKRSRWLAKGLCPCYLRRSPRTRSRDTTCVMRETVPKELQGADLPRLANQNVMKVSEVLPMRAHVSNNVKVGTGQNVC
jgi:hypothetical protein